MIVSSDKRMTPENHRLFSLIGNTGGGAAGMVIILVLVLALACGGGYWAYNQYDRKEPLRTRLSSMKMREEVIRFTHDRVSSALYHNLVTLDDSIAMMNRESDRLNRIAKKFPNQSGIVESQIKELIVARDKLAKVLADVTGKIEKMYVTWLVDPSEGNGQINSQRGTLTRQMADALRGEAVLIGRIRSHPDTTS